MIEDRILKTLKRGGSIDVEASDAGLRFNPLPEKAFRVYRQNGQLGLIGDDGCFYVSSLQGFSRAELLAIAEKME